MAELNSFAELNFSIARLALADPAGIILVIDKSS